MNAVSKTTAFPPTVQPGLPQLRTLPTGWSRDPIGKHLREVRRPVSMADNEVYRLVTAKRARGGIVPREELSGREISVKSQFTIEEGDFLISKRQIVHGACGLVPQELSGAIVSNEYGVLRSRQSIDSRFLSYLSHSIYFQQTCFHSATGVHIEKMIFKLDKWLEWEFDLPPLPEQKKIVEILSTWDQAIETTENLLANAEGQRQAFMQQLLTGNRRLGDFSDEWERATLDELTERITKGTTPTTAGFAFTETGVNFVKAESIDNNGEIVVEKLSKVSEGCHAALARSQLLEGDILATIAGAIGRIAITRENILPANTNQAVAIIRMRADLQILPEFVACYLQSAQAQDVFRSFITAGAQPNISLGQISSVHVPVPRRDEQSAILSAIGAASRVRQRLREQVDVLRQERHALMQALLTGKRRVTV